GKVRETLQQLSALRGRHDFTSGLDGLGSAYSGTLLGNTQFWQGVSFAFGPTNAPDFISSTGQVIQFPRGQFSSLCLVAAGIKGNQTSQRFVITYADGERSNMIQSLSDWFTPQSYSGESTL